MAGRYGDEINPDGDFKAMQKMKQVLKDGGLLLLAVCPAFEYTCTVHHSD